MYQVSNSAFLGFLDDLPDLHLPRLRDVVLCLRSPQVATEALFCGLAVRSSLTELEFPLLDSILVWSAKVLSAHLFRDLRYLMCSGGAEALISLVPHLHTLEVANLITWGEPQDLLLHFAKLTNLQELIVRQVGLPADENEAYEICTRHILEIGKRCKKLTRLHLEDPVNDKEPIVVCYINSVELDQLLSTMPQLQHLCLKLSSPYLDMDPGIIGKRCRDLRSLSIGGAWDIGVALGVTEEECLFPQLRVWEMDSIEDYSPHDWAPGYVFSPQEFSESLKQHCPLLEELPGVGSIVYFCEEEWPAGWPFAPPKPRHRNANLAAFLPDRMALHSYYYNVLI